MIEGAHLNGQAASKRQIGAPGTAADTVADTPCLEWTRRQPGSRRSSGEIYLREELLHPPATARGLRGLGIQFASLFPRLGPWASVLRS